MFNKFIVKKYYALYGCECVGWIVSYGIQELGKTCSTKMEYFVKKKKTRKTKIEKGKNKNPEVKKIIKNKFS